MVVRRVDVIDEKVEQLVRFDLFELGKPSYEADIHIERLEPCYRVRPHSWMVRINRSPTWSLTPIIDDGVILQTRCMDRVQAVGKLSAFNVNASRIQTRVWMLPTS